MWNNLGDAGSVVGWYGMLVVGVNRTTSKKPALFNISGPIGPRGERCCRTAAAMGGSTKAVMPFMLVHATTDIHDFHRLATEKFSKFPGVGQIALLPSIIQLFGAIFFEPHAVLFDKSIASFLVVGNFERNSPTLENQTKHITRIERNKKRGKLPFSSKQLIEFLTKFKPVGGFGEGRVIKLKGTWSQLLIDVLPDRSGGKRIQHITPRPIGNNLFGPFVNTVA